jgi:membrane protein
MGPLQSHYAIDVLVIFPFRIFTLSTAGQVGAEIDRSELIDFVFGNWPDQLSGPIEHEIAAFTLCAGLAAIMAS